jgi:hypothetical protein
MKPHADFTGIRIIPAPLLRPGAACCLPGIGILVHPDSVTDQALLQHEYGHYLQYAQTYGASWYWRVGLPSLLNYWRAGGIQSFWTEADANRRAAAHFGNRLHADFKRYFPIH